MTGTGMFLQASSFAVKLEIQLDQLARYAGTTTSQVLQHTIRVSYLCGINLKKSALPKPQLLI